MKNVKNSLSKFLITVILTLLILIMMKKSDYFKRNFYKNVYEKTISFSYINTLYKNYFGNILPENSIQVLKPVFHETLVYDSMTPYLDGVNLNVSSNYLVPSITSGVVVYIGKKDGYGNVIIINNSDNVDIWYGNMDSIDVKLYDHIETGTYLGSASNNLYMVFKRDGNVLDYNEFI